ncbi:MAG: SRPBCC family protein [Bacteroidia bacterium]
MELIRIQSLIAAPLERVWRVFTEPEHVMQWNAAIAEWHCPAATNDLRVGGAFSYTMAARDGSFSFDFGGTYTAVEPNRHLAYTLGDGRKVTVDFVETAEGVMVIEDFEPEQMNSREMQQGGWQAILNNFAKHCESVG